MIIFHFPLSARGGGGPRRQRLPLFPLSPPPGDPFLAARCAEPGHPAFACPPPRLMRRRGVGCAYAAAPGPQPDPARARCRCRAARLGRRGREVRSCALRTAPSPAYLPFTPLGRAVRMTPRASLAGEEGLRLVVEDTAVWCSYCTPTMEEGEAVELVQAPPQGGPAKLEPDE